MSKKRYIFLFLASGQGNLKNNKETQVLNNNNNVELQCKSNTGDVVSISGDEDFLFIAYHSMFSSVMHNLDFINGSTDLNDLDMFLESVLKSYKIAQITTPELELFQCLAFGLSLKYSGCVDPKNYLRFAEELESAYQDICKISTWIKSLFSDRQGPSAVCLFTVSSSGVVVLKYKKAGARSYTDFPVSPAKFDLDNFIEFSLATGSPLTKMDIYSAKAIHNLICENVRFICGLGEMVTKYNFQA
ncbi:MAG: hypothetical protein NTV32_08625 [Gammaproteobacteria bacterium]|nr:hypothetical protein [Gammaproteobacteria bacterium]